MTRHSRQATLRPMLHIVAPEQLLLLTIFGSSATRQRVSTELDRRAALRPKWLRSAARSAFLRPAA